MLFSPVSIAIAFIGAVNAVPTSLTTSVRPTIDSVSAASSIPVVDLASIDVTHQNVTLASHSSALHVDAAQAPFPATLFLCPATGCTSCLGFDLSVAPHSTCLIPNPPFTFTSMFISQPSNEGFSFGVFVGPTCTNLALLPTVNTCFNAVNGPFQIFELIP